MRWFYLSLAIVGAVLPRRMSMPWLPAVATCLIGVSCGLPLFLYLRERQAALHPGMVGGRSA